MYNPVIQEEFATKNTDLALVARAPRQVNLIVKRASPLRVAVTFWARLRAPGLPIRQRNLEKENRERERERDDDDEERERRGVRVAATSGREKGKAGGTERRVKRPDSEIPARVIHIRARRCACGAEAPVGRAPPRLTSAHLQR